jgi:hypothetical protein
MSVPDQNPFAVEMSRFQITRSRFYYTMLQFRRRYIPHLVWWGDELDVIVTLKENKLVPIEIPASGDFTAVAQQLHRGTIYEIEKQFREVGITFDKGLGLDGRDWEWDFSLSGPISVRFKRRASKPERRT